MKATVCELYADGGCIKRNPSPFGGTIAWCIVEDGERVESCSRPFTPEEIGVKQVTNNNAELLALLEGIDALPEGWRGRVNSDSQVALGWVFSDYRRDKVPDVLRARLCRLLASTRLLGMHPRLLQGHPTRVDLQKGIGAKRNLPVSEQNVWCDKACKAAASRLSEVVRPAPQVFIDGWELGETNA